MKIKNKYVLHFLTVLLSLMILSASCKNTKTKPVTIKNIDFKVVVDDADKDIFEDGLCPWVTLENPKSDLSRLKNKDDYVINAQEVILIIDYPLNNPAEFTLKSKNEKGFTKAELVKTISETYHMIYEEEERSATIKTIPMEKREGIINRNQTNGKYGIWGHDLSDLVLSAIQVVKKENKYYLHLMIES
jgi:hypothetical protein